MQVYIVIFVLYLYCVSPDIAWMVEDYRFAHYYLFVSLGLYMNDDISLDDNDIEREKTHHNPSITSKRVPKGGGATSRCKRGHRRVFLSNSRGNKADPQGHQGPSEKDIN